MERDTDRQLLTNLNDCRIKQRKKRREEKTARNGATNLRMAQKWFTSKSYLQIKRINFQMIELAIFLLLIA